MARLFRLSLGWILLLLILNLSGCYYSHLASGQIKLLWRRQPIAEAAVDTEYSEETRALLQLVEPVRAFALDLGLRVDDQYTSFVDWPEDRIVTTLVRTRPGSLEAVPHWFPLVGSLPYKGYFDQAWAEAEAKRLREEEGFDVCVSAIRAYSTLGWFADPVTTPMLTRGAANLVETLFHELVHATAFLRDEVDFNESVAQFIGQRAAIRFLEAHAASGFEALPDLERVKAAMGDRFVINQVIEGFKAQLLEIEADPDRANLRAGYESEARAALASLPLAVYDAKELSVKTRLSDACLALRGAYVKDLPRHADVLAALDGDLEAMIGRLTEWADENYTAEGFFSVRLTPPLLPEQGL